jgi:2-polyprenyl-3-methyl-5-hydroxy-6-metoxy-1,4-benzoquinol methylase
MADSDIPISERRPVSLVGEPQAALAGDRPRLARFATEAVVRRQRRVWSLRAATWDQHGSAGLGKVTAAVLDAAAVRPAEVVVDLGCGTGQLSLPLAERGGRVLAVDVSQDMVDRLEEAASRRAVTSLECAAVPIEDLELPERSVDLVVSSYALHHLRDADKARLVSAIFTWLRPGGRLVVADMMFGRGASSSDRKIIAGKVRALARKGPGGWWRVAKNGARYLLRVHERPVPASTWTAMLRQSGFDGVTTSTIAAEAGLVTGRRPAAPAGEPAATFPGRLPAGQSRPLQA